MSLPSRLLGANPSIQVSTLLSGSLTTPSAKGVFIPPSNPSYNSIATSTVTNSTTTTITFSSIPSTYKHLQFRYAFRTNRSDDYQDAIGLRFNSDTGSNYYRGQYVMENTGAPAHGYNSGTDAQYHFLATTALSAASVFLTGVVDVYNYANTTMYKSTKSIAGYVDDGVSNKTYANVTTSVWFNTGAINRVDLKVNYGTYYAQNSVVALYGIEA